MRRLFTLAFLCSVIGGQVVAQQPTTWKRYTVEGEEFSVNLPTVPAMTTIHQSKTPETTERWERRLGAYADGVVYTIYSLKDGKPKQALKDGVDGIGSSIRSDVNTAQEITRDGFTGRQYFSTRPLGGTVQLFATDTHYYRFQAVGAPADDPRVQQFFSSLLLGKKNEGIEVTDGPGIPWEPAGGSSGTEVYSNKTVDRRPILVLKMEPSYTEEARSNRVTGAVILQAVFSANGSVTDITIVSELPFGMTEQALEATRKIKFIPAVKEGKFVSVRMQLEYNFDLF
jgi:TonB family protein